MFFWLHTQVDRLVKCFMLSTTNDEDDDGDNKKRKVFLVFPSFLPVLFLKILTVSAQPNKVHFII